MQPDFQTKLNLLIAEARADLVATSEILSALNKAQKQFFIKTPPRGAGPVSAMPITGELLRSKVHSGEAA
jgi:hypothetical protein